ncbi:hypothetical protein D3C71_1027660 [compost metagenome]
MQTINEPFEAHRHFYQFTAQIVHHAVNHRGRDQRFTDGHLFAPLWTMLEQIVDRNGQVVVRIHQARRGDDTVTVVVGVVSKRQIELVTQGQQTGHRTLGGAVHTDGAVFVEVHKAEGLINLIVNDGQIQLVEFGNALPVFDTGAAERVHAQLQARFLNRGDINDIGQPFDKRLNQIHFFHMTGSHRGIQRNTFNAFQTVSQQRVGAVFDDFGDVGISRATVWRIVFDTTIFWRIVRRSDDDTVSLRAAFFVVHQNGVRDRRRWGIAVVFLHDNVNAVRGQHFQHRNECRFGQRMSVFTDIARTGHTIFGAFFRDGLGNGQNMRFVKAVARRAATVARRPKLHCVFCVTHFWLQYIVLSGKLSDVNQIALLCRLTRTIVICHCLVLPVQGLNGTANLFNQFRRELHRLHDVFDHAAFASGIGIGDHPVRRTRDMFRLGLIAVCNQRLLVDREVDAGTAMKRIGGFSKRFVIQ